MNFLNSVDPQLNNHIIAESQRQQDGLEMIASENYTSPAIMEACGSILTNKYAEGYPGRRYYGGCEFVDVVESLAIERARKLFGAEHVNVQAHSVRGGTIDSASLVQGGQIAWLAQSDVRLYLPLLRRQS